MNKYKQNILLLSFCLLILGCGAGKTLMRHPVEVKADGCAIIIDKVIGDCFSTHLAGNEIRYPLSGKLFYMVELRIHNEKSEQVRFSYGTFNLDSFTVQFVTENASFGLPNIINGREEYINPDQWVSRCLYFVCPENTLPSILSSSWYEINMRLTLDK
jgi:hypothetical protein